MSIRKKRNVVPIGELVALISELENLPGADRQVDIRIMDALFEEEGGHKDIARVRYISDLTVRAARLTYSLDEVLLLIANEWPELHYNLTNSGDEPKCFVACIGRKPIHGPLSKRIYIGRSGANAAIALTSALLKQLVADATGFVDPVDKIVAELDSKRGGQSLKGH